MLPHSEFHRLRLCHFTKADDIVELEGRRFLERTWIGEAIGFTEWLRLEDDPENLGSLALDFSELPDVLSRAVLDRLGLHLSAGMSLSQVTSVLGEPSGSEQFVEDRVSYDFSVSGSAAYSVDCTIHEDRGLVYVVIIPVATDADQEPGG